MELFAKFKHTLQRFGIEYFNRFYGCYRATVHSNEDPENRGRLQLVVPQITGGTPHEYWAESVGGFAGGNYGFLLIPEPGESVWAMFENGDPNYPIWMQGYFQKAVPDVENYPKKRTLFLSSGQRIALDETAGSIEIDNAGAKVVLNSKGVSVVRGGKAIFLGGLDDAAEAAVLGDTLQQLLENLLDKVEALRVQCQALTSVSLQPNPATVTSVTTALTALQLELETFKPTLANLKSKHVKID